MKLDDYHGVVGFSVPSQIENADFEKVLRFLKVPGDYPLDVRVFEDPVSLSIFISS